MPKGAIHPSHFRSIPLPPNSAPARSLPSSTPAFNLQSPLQFSPASTIVPPSFPRYYQNGPRSLVPPLFLNPIFPPPLQTPFLTRRTQRTPTAPPNPSFSPPFPPIPPTTPLAQTLRKPCRLPVAESSTPRSPSRSPTSRRSPPPFPDERSCRPPSPSPNENSESGKLRTFGESVSSPSCLSCSLFPDTPRAHPHHHHPPDFTTTTPPIFPPTPPDFPPDTPRFSPPTPPDFPPYTPRFSPPTPPDFPPPDTPAQTPRKPCANPAQPCVKPPPDAPPPPLSAALRPSVRSSMSATTPVAIGHQQQGSWTMNSRTETRRRRRP